MDLRSDSPSADPPSPSVISCDECTMQRSAHCADCVVTFFVRRDEGTEPLVLDRDEEQVVRRLARAGLIPDLKYRLAG